jgi:hypothetical protein
VQWIFKRLNPNFYYRLYAFLNRKGWLMPLLLWMARKGLV